MVQIWTFKIVIYVQSCTFFVFVMKWLEKLCVDSGSSLKPKPKLVKKSAQRWNERQFSQIVVCCKWANALIKNVRNFLSLAFNIDLGTLEYFCLCRASNDIMMTKDFRKISFDLLSNIWYFYFREKMTALFKKLATIYLFLRMYLNEVYLFLSISWWFQHSQDKDNK